MTSPIPEVVPTRLVDLSGLDLHDLDRYDPDDVSAASEFLISEVSTASVNLAGTQS